MSSPVFVVGVPRSGTTLMRSVLSAHKNITIAPESHFLDVFAKGLLDSPIDATEFDELWRRFVADPQFAEFGLDPEAVAASIRDSGTYELREIFVTLLRQYAHKMGKPRFGEKTPEHYRHVDRLLQWFPDARVVYMLRDPRAVCASLLTVPWRQPTARGPLRLEPARVRRSRRIYHDAVVWRDAFRTYRQHWRHDPRVMLVRYEDLVGEPATVAAAVCGFLDEPFDRNMVTGRSWGVVPPPSLADSSRLTNWRYRHVERTLGEITTTSLSKWEGELTTWEISLIERICSETMESCGYHTGQESRGLGLGSRLGQVALAAVWTLRQRLAASGGES